MSKKHICVSCPAYRGAKYPAFDPKAINESEFDDACRFKEAEAWIDGDKCVCNWLSQSADYPTESFNAEIVRAFKENGAKTGTKIAVRFGMRGYGLGDEYELEVK